MSEIYSSFEFEREEAAQFLFNSPDKVELELAQTILTSGEAGRWLLERKEKYGEVLKPLIMYVKNLGDVSEHRVLYLSHSGFFLDDGEPRNCTACHLVCDCADVNEMGLLPESTGICDVAREIRFQHAELVGNTVGIPNITALHQEFNEQEYDFRISKEGQELATAVLKNILSLHAANQEFWLGNEVGGIHEVPILAKAVAQPEEIIHPILEKLQTEGSIEYDGAFVRMAA